MSIECFQLNSLFDDGAVQRQHALDIGSYFSEIVSRDTLARQWS